MTDRSDLSTLTEIFRDVFDEDNLTLTEETTADDVEGWTSLTHVEMLFNVEEAFRIRLKTGEIANLANVGDLIRLINSRVGD